MREIERAFLKMLNACPQGRVGFDAEAYDGALEIVGPLIAEGYVRERRFEKRLGFQLLDKGREYLGGAHD